MADRTELDTVSPRPGASRPRSDPRRRRIETEFEAFDASRRADGTFDRLDALCAKLLGSLRPDAERMAAAAGMVGCG